MEYKRYDKYLIKIMFKDAKLNNSNLYRKYVKNKLKYTNITNYLLKRYKDSESIKETLYRLLYKLEERPVCLTCGGKLKSIFSKHCSHKCKRLDKNVINKSIETSNIKYGENNYMNRNKYKETIFNKYGVKNVFQIKDISNKIKNINKINKDKILENMRKTNIEKYGVEYFFQSNIFKYKYKNISYKKYNVSHPMKSNIVKSKFDYKNISEIGINTKRKNNSFNISKQEDECYNILKEKYPDIIRQYKSDKYPFACDFYIPSLDLYIEYNGSWTHGGKPFEGTKEDNIKLEYWKSKNTKYYNNAIQTWTIRDPQKRKIAKENNLKYLEIWNIKDLKFIHL